ncbi:hypothetical protein IJJ37_02770 [Candidatus Saccharibacteria bacterium]|nr:hypothetical protein [Candidatus Saccharibacteria bacterium]
MNKILRRIGVANVAMLMLAATFLPMAEIWALDGWGDNYALVEIGGNTAINCAGGEINYESGDVAFSGADVCEVGIDGSPDQLYIADDAMTFTIDADEGYVAKVWVDGNEREIDGDNFVLGGLQVGGIHRVDFTFEVPQPEPEPQGEGNTEATFDYTYEGTGLDFFVNGRMIDVGAQEFDANNHVNFTDTYDTEEGDETVTFTFATLFINVINSVTINGQTTNFENTFETQKARYAGQFVQYEVVADKADTYVISSVASEASREQVPIGNFLWDNDDNSTEAFGDDIIGHGTIEFVSVKYEGETYTLEDFGEELGPLFDFTNSDTEDNTNGGMVLPVGAEVTLRLTPEAGYQLTNFGINGGEFEAQENVGEYTFEILPGNGHLAATFTAVDDEVNAESDAVAEGTIEFGGEEESMSVGTARLDVADATALTDEEKAAFRDQVEGYEMKNFLNISLYNTVLKAQTGDSWDTEVEELEHDATITLTLEEGVDGNDIVIVHRKDDGTFEIIETTYDPVTNTISFKTNSFSPYAIASRAVISPDTGAFFRDGFSASVAVKIASLATSIVVALGVMVVIYRKVCR